MAPALAPTLAPMAQAPPAETAEDRPGRYRVVSAGPLKELPVSAEWSRTSTAVAQLAIGAEVEVIEVSGMLDGGRRRARISSPAGWITLANTNGSRFAERLADPPPAEPPAAVDGQEAPGPVQEPRVGSAPVAKAAGPAEPVKQEDTQAEEDEEVPFEEELLDEDEDEAEQPKPGPAAPAPQPQAATAEDGSRPSAAPALAPTFSPRPSAALELAPTLAPVAPSPLPLQLSAEKAETSPGKYRIVSAGPLKELPVNAERSRTSAAVAQLSIGTEVEVVEVAPELDGGRRRARIAAPAAGWITIANESPGGSRFAERVPTPEPVPQQPADQATTQADGASAPPAESREVPFEEEPLEDEEASQSPPVPAPPQPADQATTQAEGASAPLAESEGVPFEEEQLEDQSPQAALGQAPAAEPAGHAAPPAPQPAPLEPAAPTPQPVSLEDGPGKYRIVSAGPLKELPVNAERSRASVAVMQLSIGAEVEVVEVAPELDGGRRRARITVAGHEAGWITVANAAEGGARFAERVPAPVQADENKEAEPPSAPADPGAATAEPAPADSADSGAAAAGTAEEAPVAAADAAAPKEEAPRAAKGAAAKLLMKGIRSGEVGRIIDAAEADAAANGEGSGAAASQEPSAEDEWRQRVLRESPKDPDEKMQHRPSLAENARNRGSVAREQDRLKDLPPEEAAKRSSSVPPREAAKGYVKDLLSPRLSPRVAPEGSPTAADVALAQTLLPATPPRSPREGVECSGGAPSSARRPGGKRPPLDPDRVLSQKALEKRALKQYEKNVKVALLNSPRVFAENTGADAPALSLDRLPDNIRNQLLNRSREEAESWLKVQEEMARRDAEQERVQAKLEQWYQQREAVRISEEQRKQAEREELARREQAEQDKWRKRQEMLQKRVAEWAAQKAAKDEMKERAEAEARREAAELEKQKRRAQKQQLRDFHQKRNVSPRPGSNQQEPSDWRELPQPQPPPREKKARKSKSLAPYKKKQEGMLREWDASTAHAAPLRKR